MAKSRTKPSSFSTDAFLYLGGALLAFFLVWSIWSYASPTNLTPNLDPGGLSHPKARTGSGSPKCAAHDIPAVNLRYDPPDLTFYDNPDVSYAVEKPLKDWDDKRNQWLKHHPSFAAGSHQRVVMVTGSQSKPCKNPIGDHLLLRFFKNKVDYCRTHGIDIYYNNALFHPKMGTFWAKIPTVKAAMLAHPEAEWIWWVDSDAAFTDMEFTLPLSRYRAHNLVVHGWPHLIYQKKSSTALNAGVFLVRNCQWSLDFMDTWANMGPISTDYNKWGEIQRSLFKDKLFPDSDDQTALIYLLLKDKTLTEKIYLESDYYFEGYWVDIVPTLENVTEKYAEVERRDGKLRRRHAEKVSEKYGVLRREAAENGWRRPFMTHFTGCQPCNGEHNKMYEAETCWKGMVKALNFADNQVLRNYGFVHPNLMDSDTVTETPFDYPDDGPW